MSLISQYRIKQLLICVSLLLPETGASIAKSSVASVNDDRIHTVPPSAGQHLRAYNRPKTEYVTERLRSAVSLPALPNYPGKAVLVNGGVKPNLHGGPTYYMRFRAKENSLSVINWYRDALKTYKWAIDQTMSGATFVGASMGTQATCQVTCVPLLAQGYRSEFIVEYKFLQSVRNN